MRRVWRGLQRYRKKCVLVMASVFFLSVLVPQRADAARSNTVQSNTEIRETQQDYLGKIMEELDLEEMEEGGWEPEELPEKLQFREMVEAFVEKGTDGIDASMVCEYVFDIFFYVL